MYMEIIKDGKVETRQCHIEFHTRRDGRIGRQVPELASNEEFAETVDGKCYVFDTVNSPSFQDMTFALYL